MDLSRLSYTKGDSQTIPGQPAGRIARQNQPEDSKYELPEVHAAYQKPEGILSSSLVFVISGGEKREAAFLRELIMKQDLRSLRVVFMSQEEQGLQPYQMQEKWREIQSSREIKADAQSYHLEDMDQVFLLSDVDEYYDQLKGILNNVTEGFQVQWIVSNPCFEIWLYYCFLNNPETDLKCLKAEPVSTRSQKLKSLCNSLVKGGMNPVRAFQLMHAGIDNSKEHYRVDDEGIPVLYATQMHEMAQYLIDTMNRNDNEYEMFLKMKAEQRAIRHKERSI